MRAFKKPFFVRFDNMRVCMRVCGGERTVSGSQYFPTTWVLGTELRLGCSHLHLLDHLVEPPVNFIKVA